MELTASWEDTILQFLKSFPELYLTRRFVTTFINPPPPTRSYSETDEYIPYHPNLIIQDPS
jgi:hypothetical protein